MYIVVDGIYSLLANTETSIYTLPAEHLYPQYGFKYTLASIVDNNINVEFPGDSAIKFICNRDLTSLQMYGVISYISKG